MASIVNEVESLSAFIEPLLAGVAIHYQTVPVEPKSNELAVRFMQGDAETETAYHYRLNRDYQFVYFAKKEIDCLQVMTKLEQKLNSAQKIPIKNSTRYLCVDSFSFSQPFKTEGGQVFAIIGVLTVELREARPQNISQKINYVSTRYK